MSKILFLLCFALCGVSLVSSRWWTVRLQADAVTYSPELQEDAIDFIKLIPAVEIDSAIAEHMFTDSAFRKAMMFLSSPDFKKLQQRAESMPEIIEVINFAHLNDTVIKSRILVNKQLKRQFIESAYKNARYQFSNTLEENEEDGVVVILLPHNAQVEAAPATTLNSVVSFIKELLQHLPRDKFVAMIKEKRKTGKTFPKFYEAIRSEAFGPLLEKAMKSQNVQTLIKTLAQHEIDAVGLKNIALEVISWGPPV